MYKQVEIKILDDRAKIPSYGTIGSAGLDLVSLEDYVLIPNDTVMVGTGIAVSMRYKGMRYNGMAAVILPRSGLGSKGLILGNSIGLIDSDYQGELKICMWNRTNETKYISQGDRIAQLVFIPIIHADFKVVEEFGETTTRGTSGFGSTGISGPLP